MTLRLPPSGLGTPPVGIITFAVMLGTFKLMMIVSLAAISLLLPMHQRKPVPGRAKPQAIVAD